MGAGLYRSLLNSFYAGVKGAPPGRGYPYTSQAGVFFLNGKPKPSYTAFRFPLVASPLGRGRVLVWGIAPEPGRVGVQVRHRGAWRTAATVRATGRGHPFAVRLHVPLPASFRARLGSEGSLVWQQG